MTRNKLPETPTWLKIVRRIYTYIGGGSLLTILQYYNYSAKDTAFILSMYIMIGMVVQIICDVSFKTEKIQNLKPDPKN